MNANIESQRYFLRPARVEDACRLARMYRIGSAGLMDAVYAGSEAYRSTTGILARRISDPASVFGYRNFTVADNGRHVIGIVCAFPDEQLDAGRLYEHLRPDRREILEIINSINYPGSLYVSALAVGRRHRGTSVVRSLLLDMETRAGLGGLDHVSIHVFGANSAAIELYCRMGYEVCDSRRLPPDPALVYDGPIVLLAKRVS